MVSVDGVRGLKTLFTARVTTCEWWGVDMCRVRFWDRSNWRANSSAFSEERKFCLPLQSNGGLFVLLSIEPIQQCWKTVLYSSLLLCWLKLPCLLWFLSNLPLLVCWTLLFSWSLHWCSCHWWWEPPNTCSCLLCWYLHHPKRCLLFQSARYCSFL